MANFVGWHTLTSLPPNGLNRDGDGLPKTTRFGDGWRGFISSQSQGRARRTHMGLSGELPMGARTRLLRGHLAEALVRHGRDAEEASQVVRTALEALKIGIDGKDMTRTKVMLFVGDDQLEHLAHVLHRAEVWNQFRLASLPKAEDDDDKNSADLRRAADDVLEVLQRASTAVDLALWGRMVAESGGLNIEGAAQTAPAISVSRHTRELDYFTAVDDFSSDDSGAGMLGDVAFSCGVFYGLTVVNWDRLVANLGGDCDLAKRGLAAYLLSTINALGSGKQHSFYSHTPPSLVLAEVARRQPYSLCNAFEKPVDARQAKGDLVQASIEALDAHLAKTHAMFGTEDVRATLVAGANLPRSGLSEITVPEMIERVVAEVSAG